MNGLAKALTMLAACAAMMAMGAGTASALKGPISANAEATPFISADTGAIAMGRVVPAADTTGIKTTETVLNNANTYNVGDPAVFTIGSKVPVYTFATSFMLKVDNVLSRGLTYDSARAHVTVTIGGEELHEVPAGDSTGYQLSVASSSSAATTLSFDFSSYINGKIGNHDFSLGNEPIKISYTAYVNAKAYTGNDSTATTSSAKTEYNDDPGNTCKNTVLPGPVVKLYTGGFAIDKISRTSGEALPTAEFQIRRKGETNPLKFVRSGGEGTASADYILPESLETGATVDTLVVPQSGKIKIEGLADGIYVVKESKAPEGYLVPSGFSFNVTITHDFDASNMLTGVSYSQSGDMYGLVKQNGSTNEFTVSNVQSVGQLPASGAAGILMRLLIGLVLVAVAAALYFGVRYANKRSHKTNAPDRVGGRK